MSDQAKYIIASVDRALQLLIILENAQHGQGITEISKAMSIHKSTVHSILQTLAAKGFVRQTATGKYALGARLIEMGNTCAERLDIKAVAHPIINELADSTGEIALLAILAQHDLIIIDKIEPPRTFLIIPRIDFHRAIHSTAIGRVLIAYADPISQQHFFAKNLQQFTIHTKISPEQLQEEFTLIRQQGYACCCDETIEGITCLAVPIIGSRGATIAALTVSCSSSSISPIRQSELINKLKLAARNISQRLGGVTN